jgi:hypothetical protein
MEASYDGSISGSAGVSTGNDNASASLEVSGKIGTIASVKGGLDGNNVYVGASYSDTSEAHLTVSGEVGYEGVGGAASADAYVKSGTEAELSIAAGQNGVAASAGASIGNAAGVDAEATLNMREASVTGGAGVSIGEHFEAGAGGEATFKGGKATIGVSGELAAIVGLDVDVSVTVDTKQIQKDTTKATNIVIKEAPKAINTAVHETAKVGNTIANESKKTANKAKKFFHL